jgi:hypothetical protein
MTKKRTSVLCCDTAINAWDGMLAGVTAASLYHVYLALLNQVPENVLGELAAAAFCGAIVFAVGSALCNRLKRRP